MAARKSTKADPQTPAPAAAGPDEVLVDGTAYRLEHSTNFLRRTHPATACTGRPCPIHNRTEHPLRSWRQHWRSDRGIMERRSPFGNGCPDPDQEAYWKEIGHEYESVHGCVVNPAAPDRAVCAEWELDGVRAAWLSRAYGYAVTADGRIWSWRDSDPDNPNKLQWDWVPTILPVHTNTTGHAYVTIPGPPETQNRRKDGTCFVDLLVLLAFRGERPTQSKVVHINGDGSDNRLENIRYSRENSLAVSKRMPKVTSGSIARSDWETWM